MEVNGSLLAQERKKIRALNPGRGKQWAPSKGTQEWLALKIGKTLRTVQNLEKGRASLPVLQAVCRELNLDRWEKYVLNYGTEYLSCITAGLVDFRSEKDPNLYADSFFRSTTLMTIDPLSISLSDGVLDYVNLKSIKAKIKNRDLDINLCWLAEVSLTPAGNGWLGWIKPAEAQCIEAGNTVWQHSIMFNQTDVPPVLWLDFIKYIDNSNESQLNISLDFDFGNIKKSLTFKVSIELLQQLFIYAREKYDSPYPRRAQVKPIN